MNEWINEQVHERMDELVNERMNKCINECYVVLCCAVLWYGQFAQTFYMCLESLVGCMKEHFGSFTYFSADGTILRSFAKYFWADGVCWRILKHFEVYWSNFEAILMQSLAHV